MTHTSLSVDIYIIITSSFTDDEFCIVLLQSSAIQQWFRISLDDIRNISTVYGKSFIDRKQSFWTKFGSTNMTDEFIRKGLTTSVAQICSNIGWHSMSNSTLQMMTDILYEYFRDLAQSVKKFSEICEYLFAYAVDSTSLNME